MPIKNQSVSINGSFLWHIVSGASLDLKSIKQLYLKDAYALYNHKTADLINVSQVYTGMWQAKLEKVRSFILSKELQSVQCRFWTF